MLNLPRPRRGSDSARPDRFLVLIVLLAIGVVAGCSEDDSPVGFDRGDRGPSLSVPETLLVATPVADVEIRPSFTTGLSASLLVGEDSLATSRALIRFTSVPDTTGMRRAFLRLYVKQGRGGEIDVAVRRVTGAADSWSPNTVTFENAPAAADVILNTWQGVKTATVPVDEFTQLRDLEIPLPVVRRWVEEPDSNAGLQLSWSGGRGTARFVSGNDLIYNSSGNRIFTPGLILVDEDSTDIRFASVNEDAYVCRSALPEATGDDEPAGIGSGPASRLLLRFDIGALPPEASIVRSRLVLRLRAGQFSEDLPVRMSAYEITQEWTEGSVPDSLETATSATDSRSFTAVDADSIAFELDRITQAWVNGTENDGVLLRLTDEASIPRRLDIHTREAVDPSLRPSLMIVYVRVPDPRW